MGTLFCTAPPAHSKKRALWEARPQQVLTWPHPPGATRASCARIPAATAPTLRGTASTQHQEPGPMSFIQVRNSVITEPCPDRPCISRCRCPQQPRGSALGPAAAIWATARRDWAHAAGLLSCPGAP